MKRDRSERQNYEHTARRLLERHDIVLPFSQYKELNRQILAKCFKKVPSKDDHSEAYKIDLDGKDIIFVFNPNSKRIETALPNEQPKRNRGGHTENHGGGDLPSV